MAHKNTAISALVRSDFGKGASRQLRRDGRIPAVAYGHNADPIHLSFDGHDIFLATKGVSNALLTVDLEGETVLALVKAIQRNPLSRNVEHVDLLRVSRDEKVDVEVPVEVTGESASGTIHTIELMHLLLKAPAIDIPESIVIDVTGREEGAHVTIGDIDFPEGVTSEQNPSTIVVVIAAPEVDLALEAADAAAASAASAASEAAAE
ncbi:50S ribosomal protein L25/general stress protein Ctc [Changpingibacter yushuensis]|uniref:50S ribosomal protein L25/general stress protein Ctc n=1 Tax=Changpingibacter yushuensis TaxID=2758440 RepID=UPI00165EB9FC|nr:50S ribosomal protein L25/general stress protein Ctc [Changpingibacter yushuensis]